MDSQEWERIDGREYLLGSPGHALAYYRGSEKSVLGDLSNYGAPLWQGMINDFVESGIDPQVGPYLKAFFGILSLIAADPETRYSVETRAAAREALETRADGVKEMLDSGRVTIEDLVSLQPVLESWESFRTRRRERINF